MMRLINDRYTYRISWFEEDGEYVGLCAEFPSLSWLDETPEAALTGIRQVVAEVVTDMQNDGEQIPVPHSMYSSFYQNAQLIPQTA